MTPFLKMNGLGNDFAVIDVRKGGTVPSGAAIRALADRAAGIGFDQLITIAPAPDQSADAAMRIHNADGREVEACGNGARCVVQLLLPETAGDTVRLASAGGALLGWAEGADIAIDMGEPRFAAADIPLAPGAGDPLQLLVPGFEGYGPAACVSVGNPHAVFFVPDIETVPLAADGPALEVHPFFPEHANITVAQVTDRAHAMARVWERGAGLTRACGTAACAVLAVGQRLGRLADAATIALPGGPLRIALREGRIVMRGPAELEWRGTIEGETFTRD